MHLQFDVQAFNDHLANMGEWFGWRKSAACPCLDASSGAATPGCPHCDGKGRLWGPAVRALAGVASSQTQLKWAKMGMWEQGDMVLSIPSNSPLYAVGQYDRVVAETSSDPFSIPLIHGAVKERIHGPIQSIDRVFWFDGSGDIVEGGIPVVALNGTLTWPNGGEPPAKTSYSLSGTRRAEFYCFGQFSSDRNKQAGLQLPRRMVMRKFDLFGRNGSQ